MGQVSNNSQVSTNTQSYPCSGAQVAVIAALSITGVALAILGALPLLQLGLNSLSFSGGAILVSVGGSMVIVAVALGAIYGCKQHQKSNTQKNQEQQQNNNNTQKNQEQQQNNNNTQKNQTTLSLDPIPLKLPAAENKKGKAQGENIAHTCTTYSPKRPVEEKLAIQLDYALREGCADGKAYPKNPPFTVDLESPINTEVKIDQHIQSDTQGAAETQNEFYRRDRFYVGDGMEDAHIAINFTANGVLFKLVGVFDGHGDFGKASKYARQQLPFRLQKALQNSQLNDEGITNALTKTLVEFDQELIQKGLGGTTACCSLISDDKIYTANVGDSRGVLCREKDVLQLSEDASPDNSRFVNAVDKMGKSIIFNAGALRVEGKIALTRDLGEDILSGRPKITRLKKGIPDDLTKMDVGYQAGNYLVIACDGLWDVARNSEVKKAVTQMAEAGMKPAEMAARLVHAALKAGTTDNVTCLVVKLD
jgi:serine/threonine protein phosphatase PrpC